MSDFFSGYVTVVAFFAAGLWLLIGVARINYTWRASQAQTAGLRQLKTEGAKILMERVDESMKLDEEIKESRQRTEMLKTALETKEKQLTNLVPPPPPAVYVTSEFPPSSRDKPWQALLRRTTSQKTRRGDEPSERYVLVWAPDHTGAQGRAQNALSNYPGFTIDGVMRFD
jgi:hypothetical protein